MPRLYILYIIILVVVRLANLLIQRFRSRILIADGLFLYREQERAHRVICGDRQKCQVTGTGEQLLPIFSYQSTNPKTCVYVFDPQRQRVPPFQRQAVLNKPQPDPPQKRPAE